MSRGNGGRGLAAWPPRLAVVAAALALLAPAIAFGIDRWGATDVTLIVKHPSQAISANKLLWAEGDPVADIYGSAASQPARIAFADPTRLLHPTEAPSLALYEIAPGTLPQPLQVKTIWFLAIRASLTLAAVAMVLGLVAWRMGRSPAGPTKILQETSAP